jgi:hypothetical protein
MSHAVLDLRGWYGGGTILGTQMSRFQNWCMGKLLRICFRCLIKDYTGLYDTMRQC